MNKKDQEKARRAFAKATSILEDAHAIATAGQSGKLTENSCARYARKLLKLSQKLQRTAESLENLARQK